MEGKDLKFEKQLIFVSGVAVGSLITWLAIKKKYKDEAQYQIESVKEAYSKINKEAIERAAAAKNKPDISMYTKVLEQSSTLDKETEESEEEYVGDEPIIEQSPQDDEEYLYEIDKESFASYTNDNTRVSVTYYADDVFADEMYDKIDPREYFDKRLVLLDGGAPVNTIEYIRRMTTDELIIRDGQRGLDIDISVDDRTFSDYMST